MSTKTKYIVFGILVLSIFLLASCQPPATISYQEKTGTTQSKSVDDKKEDSKEQEATKEKVEEKEETKEESKEESKSEDKEETKDEEKEDSEPKAKDLLKKGSGEALVTTIGESSQIDATFFGKNERFTVPYTDRDAIVFDIAQKFGITISEVRLVVSFDGQAYLREAEKEQLELEVKGQESVFNETESNPFEEIGYEFTKDDGFLRGIGCDLTNKVLKFQIYNFKEDTVFRYDPSAKPKIKNPMTIYFNNKRLIDSFCDGSKSFAPNETTDCYHSGVDFVRGPQTGSIYDEIELNEEFKDKITITQPGYNEQYEFVCTGTTAPINSSESSNQSNSTA